jgi:dimethylhistidine N-methyltransferase
LHFWGTPEKMGQDYETIPLSIRFKSAARQQHFMSRSNPSLTLRPELSEPSPTDTDGFAQAFFDALRTRPHSISPKYFYDAPGSVLFDRICELPEYYPTRTEAALLRTHVGEMAELAGSGAEIVEFGAGSLQKVRTLLDAFDDPAAYFPIDISGEHLIAAAGRLSADYPSLDVHPVVADYTHRLMLPARSGLAGRKIGFFPGSTIGNFMPDEALAFLRRAAQVLRGGAMVLGVDLVKSPGLLHAAYNDADGITAQFNLNLLARANRELGTKLDLTKFEHYAFYNAPHQRIEMHLVNLKTQMVNLDGEEVRWPEGQSLHTEYSHKFTVEGLRRLAVEAGFEPKAVWVDAERLFSIHWLEAPQA